ncbi:hypothetical protein M5X11_26165 [Paenibacillus alginolyticus]|uniref:Uncharacterized protein n=1 Tax=Paenibacillus alginolyticus TaxID=59839 RepID=A0ABT4GGT3_9BACL|nr:hypothetical protein [Paenibacillus alginolyticus]MCY9668366.1 hypothetical protein [Paenibacillus alginolyticus]MCY9695274.1 hypothetical protein [Paenibacillus alginolyticus]MEC0144835.1 hypothetical protein [Paenibacillus alginolyticus]
MKQTKTAFQWDSITHIFTPEITSNPQLRLQKPELIESDIRGELKRYSGKSDALPQGQPGYRIHKMPEYLIVNVPISKATPKRNLSVYANSRSIWLEGLVDRHCNLRIANAASVHKTDISQSNCPKDELYAECV